MKKVYEKPELLVENFILSDFVADCSTNVMLFALANNCQPPNVDPSDEILGDWYTGTFAMDLCEVDINSDEYYGTACYHNPSGTLVIYGS